MKWVRHINGHPAKHKIVCTQKGSEALYPSAESFFYDWEQVADTKKNSRLHKTHDNHHYLCKLREQLKKVHPEAEFVYPTLYLDNKREWNFIPEPSIKRGLAVDIVVGPRWRQYGMKRNFNHWQEVISNLANRGFTIGAIGAEETSVPNLKDVVYKSWDYDFLDAGIEMLRNCRLALMSCSGPAHLAVLCNAPLKVIYDISGRAVDGRGEWYMGIMQAFASNHCEPIVHAWNDPAKIYRDVTNFLSN